jgi:hypothetical protein
MGPTSSYPVRLWPQALLRGDRLCAPSVLCTGTSAVFREYVHRGVFSYLQKPFEMSEGFFALGRVVGICYLPLEAVGLLMAAYVCFI